MAETEEQEQSFLSHLIELRTRIIRAAASVLVVFLALSPFMNRIFDLLSLPLMSALPQGTKLLATGVIAPFFVPLKVTLFLAFVLALPFVLYQVWAFVAPGLYPHERRLAGPVILSSVLMFVAGVAYCYFFVFNVVFHFIAGFAPASVSVAPDIDAYVGFVLGMFLGFGGAFELPIVVLLLVRFGVVTIQKLTEVRRYVIVGAFLVAAIFTPPDALSMMLLAIPLCVLYEVGIVAARLFGKRTVPPDEVAAPAADGS